MRIASGRRQACAAEIFLPRMPVYPNGEKAHCMYRAYKKEGVAYPDDAEYGMEDRGGQCKVVI